MQVWSKEWHPRPEVEMKMKMTKWTPEEKDGEHEHDARVWEHARLHTQHHMEKVMGEHGDMLAESKALFDAMVEDEKCDGGKCKCKACIVKGAMWIMKDAAMRIKKTCKLKQ